MQRVKHDWVHIVYVTWVCIPWSQKKHSSWFGSAAPFSLAFRKMVTMTLYVRQQKRHMYWTVFWTPWERARAGWYGRMALKHVYYRMWNELPVQVQCMRQGAQGWYTGMTQRDGVGREEGGGFRMGNTCTPMADSCQCMAVHTLQYYTILYIVQ